MRKVGSRALYFPSHTNPYSLPRFSLAHQQDWVLNHFDHFALRHIRSYRTDRREDTRFQDFAKQYNNHHHHRQIRLRKQAQIAAKLKMSSSDDDMPLARQNGNSHREFLPTSISLSSLHLLCTSLHHHLHRCVPPILAPNFVAQSSPISRPSPLAFTCHLARAVLAPRLPSPDKHFFPSEAARPARLHCLVWHPLICLTCSLGCHDLQVRRQGHGRLHRLPQRPAFRAWHLHSQWSSWRPNGHRSSKWCRKEEVARFCQLPQVVQGRV